MLNVKVTGLLCISMLPVESSCNLSAVIVNIYANIKTLVLQPNVLSLAFSILCLASCILSLSY